jgi:hypothetical protein
MTQNGGPVLISCVGAADLDLLPHFLDHYLGLGIAPEAMRLILNAGDEADAALAAMRDILTARGVAPAEVWIAPYTSGAMWEKRRAMQARSAGPRDWVISADVDELHEYPEPLKAFLARLDREGVDVVQGPFVDRLAPEGRLAPVRAEPSIWAQFPIEADVIWSVGGRGEHHGLAGTIKLMAFRGHVAPHIGGHNPAPGQDDLRHWLGRRLGEFPGVANPRFRLGLPARVHHFHWTEGLAEKLGRRLATPGVSPAGREYGAKLLAHFDAHGGVSLRHARVGDGGLRRRLPWRLNVAALRAEARLLNLRERVA